MPEDEVRGRTPAADEDTKTTRPAPPGDEVRPGQPERPLFQHPRWMLGVVLVLALWTLGAGIVNPIWLLIGSPFLLVLAVYLWSLAARHG